MFYCSSSAFYKLSLCNYDLWFWFWHQETFSETNLLLTYTLALLWVGQPVFVFIFTDFSFQVRLIFCNYCIFTPFLRTAKKKKKILDKSINVSQSIYIHYEVIWLLIFMFFVSVSHKPTSEYTLQNLDDIYFTVAGTYLFVLKICSNIKYQIYTKWEPFSIYCPINHAVPSCL